MAEPPRPEKKETYSRRHSPELRQIDMRGTDLHNMTQMLTGHGHLNDLLYKVNK